ncbi:MAG: VOC family protein [Chloroflexia bacterium]|nr:VOC family protein [Chloroflexia bacterium]
MSTVQPILYVEAIDEALAFYLDRLGFTELWVANDEQTGEPAIAAVQLEEATIMLSPMPMFAAADGAARGEGVMLWFNLDGSVDDYFARFRDAPGATLTQELIDYPWGDRAFTLREPSGYTLTFANYREPEEPAES